MPKNMKGEFQHPFCRKIPKKLKGDPLVEKKSEKKSHNAEKKLKVGTL